MRRGREGTVADASMLFHVIWRNRWPRLVNSLTWSIDSMSLHHSVQPSEAYGTTHAVLDGHILHRPTKWALKHVSHYHSSLGTWWNHLQAKSHESMRSSGTNMVENGFLEIVTDLWESTRQNTHYWLRKIRIIWVGVVCRWFDAYCANIMHNLLFFMQK